VVSDPLYRLTKCILDALKRRRVNDTIVLRYCRICKRLAHDHCASILCLRTKGEEAMGGRGNNE